MENISIIIRTFNRENLLFQALESVIEQSYKNIEIIVINAGDPLSSNAINKLNNLNINFFEYNKKLNRPEALNKGIHESKGDYIYFLDDDDILYKDGLQNLINAAEGKYNFVYGTVICKYYESPEDSFPLIYKIFSEPFNKVKLIVENYIPINSFIIKKSFIKQVGYFNENFEIYEDWEWLTRVIKSTTPIFINKEIAEYRIFEEQSTILNKDLSLKEYYKKLIFENNYSSLSPEEIYTYINYVKNTLINQLNVETSLAMKLVEKKDNELINLREKTQKLEKEFIELQKIYTEKINELIALKKYTTKKENEIDLLKSYIKEKENEITLLKNFIEKVKNNKLKLNTLSNLIKKNKGK